MLSWDDFRIVKAIADRRSLGDAAKALAIDPINRVSKTRPDRTGPRRAHVRADRSGYAYAARRAWCASRSAWEHEVAAFEHSLHDKSRLATAFAPASCPLDAIMARGGPAVPQGHDRRQGAAAADVRDARLSTDEASDGFAAFEGLPEFRHYNPIGTVHGGFAATLLDSALGCAIFSTMAKGEAWTTLELKLNLVRPISKDTGAVRAEAVSSIAAGRSRPPTAPSRTARASSMPTPAPPA